MQFISDSLEKCWALYLELYVATHQGGSYINIRVRFVVKSKIHNFRLLEIPLYKHHTREEILNTLVILLGAILPHWEHTIIGVSTDSAQIISGRIRSIILSIQLIFTHIWGVVTLIKVSRKPDLIQNTQGL